MMMCVYKLLYVSVGQDQMMPTVEVSRLGYIIFYFCLICELKSDAVKAEHDLVESIHNTANEIRF
jgi:hypothetical protein